MIDNDFSLSSLGWNDHWIAAFGAGSPGGEAIPGRVVRRDRGVAMVATGSGTPRVVVAGATAEVVTGDWVVLSKAQLTCVLPRRGVLKRRGTDGTDQLLAANVDVVLLVCGLDRPVKPGRIARGAIQAWNAGAAPVVVLNKADLSDDPGAARAAVEAAVPGTDVLIVSSRSGLGLDEVRQRVRGSTAVLLGESGAGKSSLLNALAGTPLTSEGRVRHGDSKGRHTTTSRQLHPLPGGGVVIDTPGIRSLGLAASVVSVDIAFPDVEELTRACRFSNCSHVSEPGCAVLEAVAAGEVDPGRLKQFQRLRKEVETRIVRSDPHRRRMQERGQARLVREGQRAKRSRL